MSPQSCTICSHPQYAEIATALKSKLPRTAIAARWKLDYTSLNRCWHEHQPQDHEYQVSEAIPRTRRQLDKELKKKTGQDRILVKDLETRLTSLRAEQRTLQDRKGFDKSEVRSNDPNTWPEWLGPFMLNWFDHLVAESDARNARQAQLEQEAQSRFFKATKTVEAETEKVVQ